MLSDANEKGNDGLLLETKTMNDIYLPTLPAYHNHCKARNVGLVFNQLDDKDLLRNMCEMTTYRLH